MIHTRARHRCFSNAEIPPRVSTKPRRRSQKKTEDEKGGTFHPSPRSHPPRSPSELTPRARATEDADEKRELNHHFFVWHWHESHAHLHRAHPQLLCPHASHVSAFAHVHPPGAHAHASPHLSHAMKKRNLKLVARSFVRSLASGPARACDAVGPRARTVVGTREVGTSSVLPRTHLIGVSYRLYERCVFPMGKQCVSESPL